MISQILYIFSIVYCTWNVYSVRFFPTYNYNHKQHLFILCVYSMWMIFLIFWISYYISYFQSDIIFEIFLVFFLCTIISGIYNCIFNVNRLCSLDSLNFPQYILKTQHQEVLTCKSNWQSFCYNLNLF